MDVTIHNALLDQTLEEVDLGIKNGKIIKISSDELEKSKEYIDAKGCLVVPPFFESHFHLDNTLLRGEVNQSGTLREAIKLYGKKKEDMTIENIVSRASETLRICLENGVCYLRSHVDIDSIGKLKLLEGVKEVKELFAGIVDVQIIAFPQMGLVNQSETLELMYAAMENGADIVGGIPHFEKDMDDAARQIEIVFEIAKKYDADIDMHVDEVDDPYWKSVELLAVLFGGLMAGLAGAFITLASVGIFVADITAGRGWLAIAIVIFGDWKPGKILLASLFFGFIDALQMQLQAVGVDLPFQLFLAMPYILTVIAVFLGRKRSGAPIALGLHYVRE